MQQVHSNSMVAHLWANQTQDSARSHNGHLFFRDSTIYSYGSHFPIARHVNGVVLFTTASYSSTTSQHMSSVRSACLHLEVFRVPHVMGDRHRDNFESYKSRLDRALLQAARARKSTAWRMREAEDLVKEANRYNKVFKLRRKPLEIPASLDKVRERAKQQAADMAAKRKTDLAKRRKLLAKAAERWKAGEHVSISEYPDILLRVSGEEIQTSGGARFPVDHGRKAFTLIKRCHDKAETYKHNGHSIQLGNFSIDQIDRSGNVKAGCHHVKWAEIARIAGLLNLPV